MAQTPGNQGTHGAQTKTQGAQADYARRLAETRKRIRDAGLDALVVSNPYNRRYLTGFSARDGDITESSGLALVTPTRLGLITGTFSLTGLEHEIEPSGTEFLSTDEKLPWDVLAEAAKQEGLKRIGFEKAWLSYDRYERMKKALGDEVELVPSDDLVKFVRATKDEAELEMLRRAARIADQAFREMTRQIRVGMTERQIAALLERLMVEMGAEGPSFPSIVAGGPGGATPHWEPSDRPVQAGEPLLIDFGVRVDGYCSDATRTLCFGEPEPQLVEVYGIVRRAQDAVIEALRSGVRRGRDIDAAARKVIDESPYKDKFIHGLGHGVGLAVHELPSAGRLRYNTPEMEAELARNEQIGENMSLTNEPGVYIPGWGGVRLEDTMLITPDGIEILTERNPEWILSLPVQ